MNNKISKQNSKQLPLLAVYAVIFVALLVLCSLFPYSGDDWAWGSSIGLERLSNWFDNYSGRYAGNLIVLALTRSNVLKTVTMATCLTGIVSLVNKITGNQKNAVYLISSVMLLMPVPMLRQAVVWTSGFANYTTSIFLMLIYICYVRGIYEDELPKYPIWHAVPMLLLGFVGSMIVEHITIYSLVLGLYVILFVLIKFKKLVASHIAFFVGAVAGALTMFSNSVYHSVATGEDGYRTMGDGGIVGTVKRALNAYLNTIMPEGFLDNFVLNVVLAGMCVVLWICVRKFISKKLVRIIGEMSLAVIVMFASLSVMNAVSGVKATGFLTKCEGLATLVYIVAMGVFLLVLPLEINKRVKLLFYYLSVGCMIAPLFVVTPIGSRCFFAPYVMMLVLALDIYANVNEEVREKISKALRVTVLTAFVAFAFLFYVYFVIHTADVKRVEKAVQDSQTQSVIEVKRLPYNDYVWCSDVKDKVWKDRFKLFNGIDKSVEIQQVK